VVRGGEDAMGSVIGARGANFLVVLSFAILICSCATPQYDSAVDKSITDLQRKINLQIDNWISGVGPEDYKTSRKFYDEADADIKSLKLRMTAAVPSLDVTLSSLGNVIESLRDLHKQQSSFNPNDKNDVDYLRQIQSTDLEPLFAVLLQAELTLKGAGGGAAQGTGSTSKSTSSGSSS
jgi:hypothetical protein